ncbi:MAG: hypothetical protein GC161_19205 [Planctomycetaceae bacterium]|nr:hypothetical protein [Planctomycetaceae bacterium]
MFRFLLPTSAVTRLTAAVAALALASQADAQIKPFKVSGNGTAPKGLSVGGVKSPYKSAGNGTAGLGKYTGTGIVRSLSFDPTALEGTFTGGFTFVAANGDKLACTHGDTTNGARQAGEYKLFPVSETEVVAVFLAEFNPVPKKCTGKFADVVDGSFLMLAVSKPFALQLNDQGFSPPFDFSWQGLGWLEFDKK